METPTKFLNDKIIEKRNFPPKVLETRKKFLSKIVEIRKPVFTIILCKNLRNFQKTFVPKNSQIMKTFASPGSNFLTKKSWQNK